MNAIERNATKLNGMVTSVIKAYHKASENLHVAFVSAYVHAAEHGQPAPLNNLLKGLKDYPNVTTAMKQFVTRVNTLLDDEGSALLDSHGKFQPSPYKFLTMEKGAFVVMTATTEARKEFVALAEARLINPDGEIYKRVDQRDNVREEKEFTTKDLLQQMKTLLAKAKGETNMINSMISPIEVKALEAAFDEITKIKEANAHKDALPARKPQVAPVKTETPKAVAKPSAKPAASAPH